MDKLLERITSVLRVEMAHELTGIERLEGENTIAFVDNDSGTEYFLSLEEA